MLGRSFTGSFAPLNVNFSDTSACGNVAAVFAAPSNGGRCLLRFDAAIRKKKASLMSLARLAAISAVAALLPDGTATAAGPLRPFQVGLWSGGAYTDDRSGEFSHCSAGVAYDSGIDMFIVSTEAHGWWLGFTNPQWSLTPGASIPAKLGFDGRSAPEALAKVANGQLLLVPMPEDSRLIATFRRSSQLAVTALELSFSLSLGGTSAVMAELTNCVRTAVALEAAAAKPAPTQALQASPAAAAPAPASAGEAFAALSPAAVSARPAPPAEAPAALPPAALPPAALPSPASEEPAASTPPAASEEPAAPASPAASEGLAALPPAAPAAMPMPAALTPLPAIRIPAARGGAALDEIALATNFLLAAGLPNARLVNADKPPALASFRAVWRADNAAGAVKIIPAGREVTGVGIASELISVDPKLCKGDFTSARTSESVDGGVVFRAVLSCADPQSELTTQYLITPLRKGGGFAVFAVIANGGANRAGPNGRKPDIFNRAAVQAVGPAN